MKSKLRPTTAKYDLTHNARNHRAATGDRSFENDRLRGSGALHCYAFFVFLEPKSGFSSRTSMSMIFANRLCLVSGFFALVNSYAMT